LRRGLVAFAAQVWNTEIQVTNSGRVMTDFIDAEGFRANVGIILCNAQARVLLAGRAGRRGWQFPQGGVHPGESPEAAMYRELEEEVGLREQHVCVVGQTQDWLRYRLPPRYIRRNSLPRCIGQKQLWFLLRLTADDSAVRLDASERPEFDRWRWVDYWRPVKEVIYFKRPVYVRALQELAPALFPEGPPATPGWWPSHWRGAGEEERPDGRGAGTSLSLEC
jgi:putative (di)nucleoside polyphosphate hydrolase